MIQYFVSYRFYSAKQEGFGCIDANLNDPIKGIKEIRDICDWIKDNIKDEHGEPIQKAVVLNWRRFEEDSYPALPADQGRRLYEACMKWRKEYQPGCGESIYQVDKVNLACPELVEELMNIIGWEDDSEESSK